MLLLPIYSGPQVKLYDFMYMNSGHVIFLPHFLMVCASIGNDTALSTCTQIFIACV